MEKKQFKRAFPVKFQPVIEQVLTEWKKKLAILDYTTGLLESDHQQIEYSFEIVCTNIELIELGAAIGEALRLQVYQGRPGISINALTKRVCPYCNENLEINVSSNVDHAPIPGALNVCGKCFEISRYTGDMELRKTSPAELYALSKENPEAHKSMLEHIAMAKMRPQARNSYCPNCHSTIEVPFLDGDITEGTIKLCVCPDCFENLVYHSKINNWALLTDSMLKNLNARSPQLINMINQQREFLEKKSVNRLNEQLKDQTN